MSSPPRAWRSGFKTETEYQDFHAKMRKQRPISEEGKCAFKHCQNDAKEWAYVDGDCRDMNNYIPLCVKCHRRADKLGVPKRDTWPISMPMREIIAEIARREVR